MNLEIDGVSFRYPNGAQAISNVRMQIRSGEQVAWIGANGAGKSTLARLANGLLRPQEGVVRVGDWDTRRRRVSELARRVGYVFQNPDEQLFARNLREEVAFGPRNLGRTAAEVEQAVEASLKALDLLANADDNPFDLHPARRKELGLASILAMDPAILILDEPTTGQDAPGVGRLGRVLGDLRRRGRTVILISHDMEFCAEYADRIAVFSQGRVVLDAPARQAFSRLEILASAQVDPPQLARLAAALDLDAVPLSVDEFLEAWRGERGGEPGP
ncbi:MAG: energy-coupling factor ABC transporter ATP-binding protein [Anaerolineales bacterium]